MGVVDCWFLSFASRPVQKVFHGDERGDNSGYGGRGIFRSQYTRHYSFHNCVEFFYSDGRSGDRFHTSQSPSHNPGGCGRFLVLSVPSRPVKKVHGDERGDNSGDGERGVFRSQYTSHSSFKNCG